MGFFSNIGDWFSGAAVTIGLKQKPHAISVSEDIFVSSNASSLSLDVKQLLQNDTTSHGALKIDGVSGDNNSQVMLAGDRIAIFRNPDMGDTATFFYDVVDGKGAKARTKATVKFVDPETEAAHPKLDSGDDVRHAMKGEKAVFEQSKLLHNDLANQNNKAPKMVSFVSEAKGFDSQLKDGLVIITPPAGYAGNATFRYETVDHQGLKEIQKVHVTFHDEKTASLRMARMSNEPEPVTKSDVKLSTSFTTDEDKEIILSPLKLASDMTGLDLTTTRITDARIASIDGSRDFEVSYTANRVKVNWAEEVSDETKAGYADKIELQYTLTDGSGKTIQKSYTVDKPTSEITSVAVEDFVRATVGFDPYSAKLQKFETSPDIDVKQVGDNTHLIGKKDFNGKSSFTYTLEDKNGQKIVASAKVAVTAVNDKPVAGSYLEVIKEGQSTTVSPYMILEKSSDSDGDRLKFGNISNEKNGTAILKHSMFYESGSLIKITPDNNFVGDMTFQYTVQEHGNKTKAVSDPATVTIRVENVNDAPEARIARMDWTVTKGQESTYSVDLKQVFYDKDIALNQSDDALTYRLLDKKTGKAAEGFALNEQTGEISGTPQQSTRLTLVATDKAKKSAFSEIVVFAKEPETMNGPTAQETQPSIVLIDDTHDNSHWDAYQTYPYSAYAYFG